MKKLYLVLMAILAILVTDSICSAADYTQDPHCMGAWMMSSSGDEPDLSGNGETLIEISGDIPTSTDSKEGETSRDFEKSDTELLYHEDGGSTDISGSEQDLSICFWIKPEDVSGDNCIVSKYDWKDSARQYRTTLYEGNIYWLISSDGTGGNMTECSSNSSFSAGTWSHVCVTHNAAGNEMQIYVNGSLDQTCSHNNGIHNGRARFSVGAQYAGGSPANYFDGLIDELIVMDRLLSAEEITDIYNGSTLANQPPTVIISANPISGQAPLEVYFTGSGTDPDGTIISYEWDFGDGITSTEQNPTYTYTTAGTYTATLTVTDNDGATGSASVTITVQDSVVSSQPPHRLIRFQARLTDSQGTLLNDGTYSLTFRLYDVENNGSPIWQEAQDVYIEEGNLDVKLGKVTALDLLFDKQYWLSVEVGTDGEMTPRFELTPVPYSFKSFTSMQ